MEPGRFGSIWPHGHFPYSQTHLYPPLSLFSVFLNTSQPGTSLVVQWLGLCASTARDMGSIPGWGTKIPHATWHSLPIAKKEFSKPSLLIPLHDQCHNIQYQSLFNIFTVAKSNFSWPHNELPRMRAQLCPTLCNPVDDRPLGSSVHRILQARILKWVAISFSRGSSCPRDWTPISCTTGGFFTTAPPGKPTVSYTCSL